MVFFFVVLIIFLNVFICDLFLIIICLVNVNFCFLKVVNVWILFIISWCCCFLWLNFLLIINKLLCDNNFLYFLNWLGKIILFKVLMLLFNVMNVIFWLFLVWICLILLNCINIGLLFCVLFNLNIVKYCLVINILFIGCCEI